MYRSSVRPRVLDAITAAAHARIALLCGAHRSGRSTALQQWAERASGQTPTVVCAGREDLLRVLRERDHREDLTDATIVVDDLDLIISRQDLPEVLDALERSPRVRLVGAVSWEGLWFAEAVAMSSEVSIVEEGDLAFTEEEARIALDEHAAAPSIALISDAVRVFAGWPPVVRAVSAVLQFEGFGDARTIEDEQRFICRVRDVLVNGLARCLTPEAMAALGPLSLVPQCSVSSAARILGSADGDAVSILAELEEAGLGAWRSINGRRRFRVSNVAPGVAERSEAGAGGNRSLHARIAVELARDRFAAGALRHALLSDDPDVFEQVLEETAADGLRADPLGFANACRSAALRGLVRSVDARALVDVVQWQVTGAGPQRTGAGDGGHSNSASGNPVLDIAEAVRQLEAGNVAVARRLAFPVEAPSGRYGALVALTRAQVLMHTAPCTHELSEMKTAIGTFRQVVEAFPGTEAAFAAVGYIAVLLCLDGDMADARHEFGLVPEGLVLRWGAGPWGRGRRLASAYLAFEELEQSRPVVVAEGIRRDDWGSDRGLAAVVEATARLYAADPQEAARTAQAALRETNGGPGPLVRDLLETIRLNVAGGRREEPREAVLFAVISNAASSRLAMARCSLRRGEVHEALASATAVLRSPEVTTRNRAEALLLVGAARCRTGLIGEAQRAVREAADLCTQQGLTTPWFFATPDVVDVAASVLDANARRSLTTGPWLSSETVVPTLTPRELVVLETRARSGSLREVAARLIVSPNTVKTQLHSAYRKLGVSSATQAAARAIELGLIDDPDSLRRTSVGQTSRTDRRLVG